MSELFASLPYIGDLYYRHIYLFYEEPQIFSCMTKTMQPYFVIAVPAKNDDSSAWLAVPISLGRLLKAEKNSIEIRDLITNPESFLWKIELENDIFDVATIDPKTLTDDFLPEYGELLDFKAGMEVLPPIDTPAVQATQEMRDIIEISLEKDDTHITEIPCAVLGDMLNNVQQLIYAIAFKNGSLRGTIPKKIKEDCALCATGMFAASVGIRLKSNELCDIHRETPLTTTLRDFNHLFMAANDKDRLREFLSTQNPRVAVKYRALLQSLLSSKTGIKINNASPNNETFIKHFSTKELSSNLILINSEIEEIVEPITVCGRLVGANVERCSFEFITVSNESIKGQLIPALSSSVFSVPQSVEADIEIRIGSDSMTREEKLLYTLTAIRPIVPQSETEI